MSNFEILKKHIDNLLLNKDFVVCAIDGGATSGKTTLAKKLFCAYDCNVFHVDDFFLRPEQKTKERLLETGGNVDYERFLTEVLEPLSKGEGFSYRPYSCKTQGLSDFVSVVPKKLNIIEGSYSLHPKFISFYDFKVFIEISDELQTKRILSRNKNLHQRFFDEWIPKEKKYFDEKNIKNCCNLILKATD